MTRGLDECRLEADMRYISTACKIFDLQDNYYYTDAQPNDALWLLSLEATLFPEAAFPISNHKMNSPKQ